MRKIWLLFSQAVTVAVAALFVVATFKPGWLGDSRRNAPPWWPQATVLQGPGVAVVPAAPGASQPAAAVPRSRPRRTVLPLLRAAPRRLL